MPEIEDTMKDAHICDIIDPNGVADPNCIPEKPVRVTFQDITSASYVIKSGIEYTPCSVNLLFVRYTCERQLQSL